MHHWVPQKGGGTTGGWLLTNVAKLDPMALSCAYFLIWFAVARATAAAHACAVYAVCVGVINVLWAHPWWNLGASLPAGG